jgi:hypothetical protein
LPCRPRFSDLTFIALQRTAGGEARAEASMIRHLLVPALTLAVLPAVAFAQGAAHKATWASHYGAGQIFLCLWYTA